MQGDDKSLSDEATFAGTAKRRPVDASLGDERTMGGGDAAGIDTVIDDIEVVDLAARYKTEGTLGRGGMGEVLLALDTRLDRKVAIKRILGEAARSKTAVSRFLTEAKAIAALNHPNVVQIYDYGRASDGPFLIMEYVDGSSLLDRCRDGALPLEEAIEFTCQLCDGLAKAHDLGIVHRDIKPANVLLTKDGLPKLTDFGLAKAEAADHQMTMTGAVLGTPDFMPPEQRKDASLVDHRSDLWSLAATLYQMVTGRSPKIIRFDLLPPDLTSVLGKALEDSKDDRYQSARELRDALKTSVVAAASAAADLGDGQCPACGVKNDSSRRFCRGCGESLEAPCLSCSKPMPMWEEICGQCGTKQAPLLEDRRGEMAARQAEAEGLLKDYDFKQAERIAVSLRDESDPRLKQLRPWATDFTAKIGKAREALLAQAGERLAEALKHEASFDYPSAIHALEQVPEILRSQVLVGSTETVADALARVTSKESDVKTLESSIKSRIASRDLGGLLPDVEKLRVLRPDRTDVETLCGQLAEREQKLAARRDEAIALARHHLTGRDYDSALAVLRKVDPSVETREVRHLRDSAQGSIKELQNYLREISKAVAQKQFDGLMTTVQAALALKPGHVELTKLLESLQARESEIVAGIREICSQADIAFKACQFTKAAALLRRVPEDRRNTGMTDLLDRCEYLAITKADVFASFERLLKIPDLSTADCVDLRGLSIQGRRYLAKIAVYGLSEPLIEQWCVKCEAANAKRLADAEAVEKARRTLRKILIGTGAAAAAVLLVAVGLWVRSSWRAATIETALARSNWQAALALDPDNVDALIGQAKTQVAAAPPQIDDALALLDRVAKLAPGRKDIDLVRVNAWLKRAVDAAAADRIDDATKALDQAKRYTDDARDLQTGRQAIVSTWLRRGRIAAEKSDAKTTATAAKEATAAGATAEATAPLRARAMMFEAADMISRDQVTDAATRAIEASRIDLSVTKSVLTAAANVPLKQAVARQFRTRFDAALADRDWGQALEISTAASAIDVESRQWLKAALASYPGGLSAVPTDVLPRLPPDVLASLPPAALASLPPLRNSIGIDLKLLPAGTFTMGHASVQNNLPHQVTLTKGFYLGVYEVTNAQWERVMGSVPSDRKGADRPVERVNWEDVTEFCRKLSALPEERQAGRVYRLPTETEWEYACRAGTKTDYCFGDAESGLGDFGWFDGNADGETHPVGQKKPNAWGLFDMHGNVWEWCRGWVTNRSFHKVVRGGSWYDAAGVCRSADRVGLDPSDRYSFLGFRLALSPSGRNPPEAAAGK